MKNLWIMYLTKKFEKIYNNGNRIRIIIIQENEFEYRIPI